MTRIILLMLALLLLQGSISYGQIFKTGDTLSVDLEAVEVVHRQKSITPALLDPMKIEKVSDKELLKAACCNLSESFETNPSVDVSFSDAVTGTRQIIMLGLAGRYTQISRENMPDVRGLSSAYGLTYIPGPWVEAIHLNKGTGSVVNGYESMAGQIDVQLREPGSMDKLYLNLFANQEGRAELNLNLGFDVGDNIGTGLLLHASSLRRKNDRNGDGFMDMPTGDRLIALNRWELHNEKGLHFQLGMKGTYIDNTGGQLSYDPGTDRGTDNAWGMDLGMKRLEGWTKLGKVNPHKPYQSIGWQTSAVLHEQSSWFGINAYDARQKSLYSNLIFQGIFGNTSHNYKAGFSIQYDDYLESFNEVEYDRREVVPGAFLEYAWSRADVFDLVAGIRYDHHNIYGSFLTPRLHIRYAPKISSVFRLSAGRGQRTANILAENNSLLASSRQLVLPGGNNGKVYGLDQEAAWNAGLNFTQKFKLDYRDAFVSLDFYRTEFINQVIVDLDADPGRAIFSNLDGPSYSNSLQAQFDYELVPRLDIRLAYRWYDVMTTYGSGLWEKPLLSRHRAFVNLAYKTLKYWRFDITLNRQGRKRIPDTSMNPAEYRLDGYSPAYMLVNAQLSKEWKESFEIYLGVENLLNYKQKDPILAADDPFGQYFDASLIWGPLFGRSVYFGLRYRLSKGGTM